MSGFTASTDWVVDGGHALNFDGTNNYVVSSNANVFQECVGRRFFSFSGWFKTATAGFGTVFSAGITTAQDPSMFLRADGTNNTLLQWFVRNGAGTTNFSVTSTSAVNTDKWIHVAAIMGGNGSVGGQLYINGVLEASQASYSGGTPTTWDRFGIGATIRSTIGTYFNGCMDDVRLYNRPLSPSEVRTLYLCGRGAGFRESTIARYDLVSGQDISLNAIPSGTTFHGPTVTSAATISANAIASGSQVFNPTVSSQSSISLNNIPSGAQVFNPTVGTADTISTNLVPSSAQFFAASVTTSATISASLVPSAVTFPGLTVGAGASPQTVTLNHISSSNLFYDATVQLAARSGSGLTLLGVG